ncbi:hypothetical protein C8R43DRAFT_1193381 [Mycena crocata]|nr:hypothetical protein C8R43DRAFT_1193381 [Mycena crocata]
MSRELRAVLQELSSVENTWVRHQPLFAAEQAIQLSSIGREIDCARLTCRRFLDPVLSPLLGVAPTHRGVWVEKSNEAEVQRVHAVPTTGRRAGEKKGAPRSTLPIRPQVRRMQIPSSTESARQCVWDIVWRHHALRPVEHQGCLYTPIFQRAETEKRPRQRQLSPASTSTRSSTPCAPCPCVGIPSRTAHWNVHHDELGRSRSPMPARPPPSIPRVRCISRTQACMEYFEWEKKLETGKKENAANGSGVNDEEKIPQVLPKPHSSALASLAHAYAALVTHPHNRGPHHREWGAAHPTPALLLVAHVPLSLPSTIVPKSSGAMASRARAAPHSTLKHPGEAI